MPSRVPEYQVGRDIPGTVYKVLKVLGQGGMGTVYEVEDTSVGKRYVLKTLHGDLADREDLAERLAREARALARLQHPNIVEVYTSGKTNDSLKLPYYVMERLSGNSLRYVLGTKGRLPPERACDIAIDLLDALDHAHEYGIVHRDVKPDNIFLTRSRDGRSLAKLLDFGIIKLASQKNQGLQTGGHFIGTFRYAPPEQILARDVTPQSDLYSAALVIYEMVAGRGPFDDYAGEMEIGKAHLDQIPPPVSRFVPVPPAVEELVMMALQKDPSLRPRDAFTFAAGLRAYKRSLGTDTHMPTLEQIDIQPISGAIPAAPFGHEEMSAGVTHVAATQVDRTNVPTVASGRVQTASFGVLPFGPDAPPRTVAEGPVSAAMMPVPNVVDRRAETREAVPNIPAAPNFDTAPIPLAVLAPKQEPPPSETFGPHTTETSQRRRATRMGVAVAITAVAILGVAALVLARARHTPAESEASQPVMTTPVVVPPAVTTPALAAEPMETTIASVVETTPTAPPRRGAVAPSHSVTATLRTPVTTAGPAQSAAPVVVRHRVGSGL